MPNDLYDVLLALIIAIIPVVVPLLTRRLLEKWGVEADDLRRRALDEALINGIAYVTDRAGLTKKQDLTLEERAMIAEGAASYALDKVPDTIKKLGVPEGNLFDLAIARLPQVLGLFGPAGAVAGIAAQVAVNAAKARKT